MSTASKADNSPPSGTPHDQGAEDARLYEHQRRAFAIHASVFGASMVMIFIVNLLTNLSAGIAGEWSSWWSVWVLLGWGLGVTVHGLVVRIARPQSPGTA